MPAIAKESLPPRDLTREILESHNIFYVEDMSEVWPYTIPDDDVNKNLVEFLGVRAVSGEPRHSLVPEHIVWMRDYLLNFRKTVPTVDCDTYGVMQCVRETAPHALNNNWKAGLTKDDVTKWDGWLDELFRKYDEVAQEAAQMQKDQKAEDCWQSFLDSEIFYDPKKYVPPHRLQLDGPKYIHLTRVKGKLWNHSERARDLDKRLTRPRQPKVDIAFGLRIWKDHGSSSEVCEAGPTSENFSLHTLQELSNFRGLHAMPFVNTLSTTKSPKKGIPSDHLLGFPFAVVEIKVHGVSKANRDYCFFQAANVASVSLKIQEKLWREAGDRGGAPPVIAFTCIGAEITLWLAFIIKGEKERTGNVMIPIWKGDVTTIWGVIQARRIYENTLKWSLDYLRPRVSEAITLIRSSWNDSDQNCESRESKNTPIRGKGKGSSTRKTTPLKETPKRQTATRSKTTPNTVQPTNDHYLEVTPVSLRRTRSVEPTVASQHDLSSPPAQTRSAARTRASSKRGIFETSPCPEKLIDRFAKLSIGNGKDDSGTNRRSVYDDTVDMSDEDYLETDDSSDAEDLLKDFISDSDCS